MINVLLNYVLVIKNNASLNASYVNTVANEWAQKKIATAEEAIQHIRQISNQAKQSNKRSKQIIKLASEMFDGKSFLIGSTSQKMKTDQQREKQRLTAVLKNTWQKGG